MMQRVGRINRVDTSFDVIYTFNFFPTRQSNDQIKLKEAAEGKINAFISLLGNDARLLLDAEEVESHELFNNLISKKSITGNDEDGASELKYLKVIRDLRDSDPDEFERIKRLPKKCRTSRADDSETCLLTYFRKGRLQKFFLTRPDAEAEELDFVTAASTLEAEKATPRDAIGEDYYAMLAGNKKAFHFSTDEELVEPVTQGSRSNSQQVLKILKSFRKDLRALTDDQEAYLSTVIARLESGSIPKQTAKNTMDALQFVLSGQPTLLKVLGVLQKAIPSELLESYASETGRHASSPREIILSEYFRGPRNG
jgi:hypothetical protein